jgi:DNA primase
MSMQSSSIDTVALLASVDLLALVSRDTTLRKVSSTRGGEYAGPCPFCRDGHDRFRVQPEQQRWWCRSCSPDERWSDAIGYVMRRDNLNFVEACRVLGAPDNNQPVALVPRPRPALVAKSMPTERWCQAAEALVTACETTLWSDRGELVRRWLIEQRGLTEATIRRWRLGWNGADLRRPRDRWGLAPDGNRTVWIPGGLVIPWYLDAAIAAIKIRRPRGEPRFVAVVGSCQVLYGVETLVDHHVVVLVESELDAMLVEQEAGDLVAVVAAGTARASLDDRAISRLLGQSRILVAYDNDGPGDAAAARLLAMSTRMRRHPTVSGKDPGEFYAHGGGLRDWITMGIVRHVAPPGANGADTCNSGPVVALTRGAELVEATAPR